jgi:hypothetical protein
VTFGDLLDRIEAMRDDDDAATLSWLKYDALTVEVSFEEYSVMRDALFQRSVTVQVGGRASVAGVEIVVVDFTSTSTDELVALW